ncbi:hypothetical protein ACX9NE_15370 [Mycobacterium sp. ML4]
MTAERSFAAADRPVADRPDVVLFTVCAALFLLVVWVSRYWDPYWQPCITALSGPSVV